MMSSRLAVLFAAAVTVALPCILAASSQHAIPDPRVHETQRSGSALRKTGTGQRQAESASLAKRRRALAGIAALLNGSRTRLRAATSLGRCHDSGPSFFDQYRCPGDVYFAPLARSQCPETPVPTCNSSGVDIGMLCKSALPRCRDARGRDPWVWPTCSSDYRGPGMFKKLRQEAAVILIGGCVNHVCPSWLLPPSPEFGGGRCVSPVMFNDGDVDSIHSGSMRMSCSPSGGIQVMDFVHESCVATEWDSRVDLTPLEASSLFRGSCTAGNLLTGNIGSVVPPAC